MSSELWNTFHDGSITAIQKTGSSQLVIAVDISYLRNMFNNWGKGFIVTLESVTLCEYQSFSENQWIDDIEQIVVAEPEILSCINSEQSILITCENGLLRFKYETFSLTLDTGEPISYGELKSLSTRYWQEFENRIS